MNWNKIRLPGQPAIDYAQGFYLAGNGTLAQACRQGCIFEAISPQWAWLVERRLRKLLKEQNLQPRQGGQALPPEHTCDSPSLEPVMPTKSRPSIAAMEAALSKLKREIPAAYAALPMQDIIEIFNDTLMFWQGEQGGEDVFTCATSRLEVKDYFLMAKVAPGDRSCKPLGKLENVASVKLSFCPSWGQDSITFYANMEKGVRCG